MKDGLHQGTLPKNHLPTPDGSLPEISAWLSAKLSWMTILTFQKSPKDSNGLWIIILLPSDILIRQICVITARARCKMTWHIILWSRAQKQLFPRPESAAGCFPFGRPNPRSKAIELPCNCKDRRTAWPSPNVSNICWIDSRRSIRVGTRPRPKDPTAGYRLQEKGMRYVLVKVMIDQARHRRWRWWRTWHPGNFC